MSKLLFCPCRSLVDTVYSLKDELQELKQVSQHFLYMNYQHRPLSVVTILFPLHLVHTMYQELVEAFWGFPMISKCS